MGGIELKNISFPQMLEHRESKQTYSVQVTASSADIAELLCNKPRYNPNIFQNTAMCNNLQSVIINGKIDYIHHAWIGS